LISLLDISGRFPDIAMTLARVARTMSKRQLHVRLITGALVLSVGTLVTPSARAQTRNEAAAAGAAVDSATLSRADREDMAPLLRQLSALGAKPIEQLAVEQARIQPTLGDAADVVLRRAGRDPLAIKAAMKVAKRDLTYPTDGGAQPLRIYTPIGDTGPLPIIVYYHGGGWVIADLDTYEASAMALAKKANAIVVAADYRKAPENPFPAAHDDAYAAYRWAVENSASFGGDSSRVAVAGESAGGNLALNVAIRAHKEGVQMPLHMLLIYPIAGTDLDTPSYARNERASPLSKAGMAWFLDKYASHSSDRQGPVLNLYGEADLSGLPPTTIVNAEIDPLESDGKLLADKLRAAGVETQREVYTGVTHEFFGLDAVLDDAGRAQNFAAAALRRSLESDVVPTGSLRKPSP